MLRAAMFRRRDGSANHDGGHDPESNRSPRLWSPFCVWGIEMKWYQLRAKANTPDAEVLIYGDIGESFWGDESTTAKQFVQDLEAIGDKTLTVRINSYGGSVADGLAIYNAIRRHPKGSTVEIDGVAASIASLIAMAGDTVRMADGALLMIHAPWGMSVGNAKDMRDTAETLDKFAEAMVGAYQLKTGKSKKAVMALLTDGADHWFTAHEALDENFIDEIAEGARARIDANVFARHKPPLKIAAAYREGKMQPDNQLENQPEHKSRSQRQADKTLAREIAELTVIAARYGVADKVAAWVDEGLTPNEIGRKIMSSNASAPMPQPSSEQLDGLYDRGPQILIRREQRGYSLARALDRAADGRPLDGLEAEVHQELQRHVPSNYKVQGGFFVPLATRPLAAMTSTTATKGAEVVWQEPGELIELLRNQSVAVQLGARTMPGLVGPVGFPKQTGSATATWVGENPAADGSESDATLGLATLNPKTLQSTTSYTRQLVTQSSVEIESFVRNDLAAAHALAWDQAVLHGSGSGNEPTGIYVAPDVNSVAMGGVPTYANLVNMLTELAKDNAALGSLGWATTPGMAGKLMQTLVASAAGSEMIWTGGITDGRMVGIRAIASNQVRSNLGAGSEHGLIVANWADVLIGMWGALEIVVDPYRLKKRGMIEVTSFQMVDIVLRHGESFCKGTGATI